MIYKEIPQEFNPTIPEVVSCFIEHDGKILLLRRLKHKPEGDKWGVLAGKVDAGEDVSEAMAREIREEIGQDVSQAALQYLTKVYVVWPEHHFIFHMFRIEFNILPEIVLKADELREHRWVSPEEALMMELVRDEDECIRMYYEFRRV